MCWMTKHEGFAFYQMDYQLNQLKTMKFNLTNKETGESLGEVAIDLLNPQKEYVLDDKTRVVLVGYYPDFSGFNDKGEPQTETPNPNNPAFIFRMFTDLKPEGETSFVAIQETLEPLGENTYKMSFAGVETYNKTGLAIHNNKTIPILFIGGGIFMLGLIIGSYFSHRRIWFEVQPNGTVHYAAHTNKNWMAIKKDLDMIVQHAKLPNYIDRFDLEKEKEKEEQNGEGDSSQ